MKLIITTFLFVMTLFTACRPSSESYDSYLLVGTYTDGTSKGISVFKLNSENGNTEFVSENEIFNPSYLALSSDESNVYAVSEGDETNSMLTSFNFDKSTGKLELINTVSADAAPCFVSVDKSNEVVLTANYTGGSIGEYVVSEDGSLKPNKTLPFHRASLDSVRQNQSHLHQVYFSPNQDILFANDLGGDAIYSYKLVKNDAGKLEVDTSSLVINEVPSGVGIRHAEFHPNGKYLYALTELSGEVLAFQFDGTQSLKLFQTILSDEAKAQGSADIHVSPDGKYLYASNRLKDDGIAIYSIDSVTGNLTKIGYQYTGVHPRNFMITDNGKLLLVANRDSDAIEVFEILLTGLLNKLDKDIKMSKPVCLKQVKLR